VNVEKYLLAAEFPEESEVETWPIEKFLVTVEPGDQDWSWKSQFAWIRQYHNDRLVDLVEDIQKNGINKPLLVGPDMRLWDGHHRIFCLYLLMYDYVPVELAPDMSLEPERDGREG
jgi:hypothetical protein